MLRTRPAVQAAHMHTQDYGRIRSSGQNSYSETWRSSGAAVQKGALTIDFNASDKRHTAPSDDGKSLWNRTLASNPIIAETWQSVCPPSSGLALKCCRQGSDAALANENPDNRGRLR